MRLVFLGYNLEELSGLPWIEITMAFLNGLKVDLPMAAYCMLIPLIMSGIASITDKAWPSRLNYFIQALLISLFSLLTIAELPIYDEWGHKLTYKALWFLQHPAEVYQTASIQQFWGGLLAVVLMTWLGIRLRKLMVSAEGGSLKVHGVLKIFNWLLWAGITLTAMRGGYAPIPVQVSDAYYSRHNILNAAAANSGFHLMSNILQNMEARKPYRFMPPEEADQIVSSLYQTEKDTTILFLKSKRPNVILFVLEGWSSDVVAPLGGYEGIAPHFSRLVSAGISFDSCYASGNLSDQGMGAVFSAFPAQPRTSVITLPNKYVHLPCINTNFLKLGYQTSFMFGGQLSYGNIRSYMYFNRFHEIVEESDFDESVYRGRLGVHDGDLFKRQLNALRAKKAPFFAALFTLSTHGPYDHPGRRPLTWGGKEKDYINSVHYADSCLNDFMTKAKNEPWFDNTLFVFIADHHHNTPKGYSYYHPEYRRIPMVFYGPVIKETFRGMKDKQVCSQLDLAATLMGQLQQPAHEFTWSRNLFNPYGKQFAFYTFDEGFGWIRPEGRLVWFAGERKEAERYLDKRDAARLLKEGKAYLQRVTEAFWRY